ncbi:porin [Caballeronia sp. GaOx3]|uniref:porin n=1 Tax=Caballeronia sp. GaOx3 TaxID=2921740 RepID=UPI0020286A91|nr:porin [Caballeronia sp. GaOx3]
MKKILLSLLLVGMALEAHAQSSVTLYGRLDEALEYMSGVPTNPSSSGAAQSSTHRFRLVGGNWQGSFWGIKGVEDLGSGNRVLFKLESGFNIATGQGSPSGIFNRWAEVGVSNDSYGTLMMGRQLFIANDVWDFDPFGQSFWASATLVRGRNWPFSSNNISYQSPKIGGFDFAGQYSFSNATNFNGNGTTPQGREAGAHITYTSALFQVRGMYDEIRSAANGGFDNPFTASREYSAMVNVFLGQFKIQGAYQAIRTSGGAATAGVAPTSLDHEWGGVTWQTTPAAALIAAVYHVNANKGAGNATMYTIGGSYNLSKRTMLNMQIATTQNSKSANFALNANDAGTTVSSDNPLPGHSQSGVYLGIQHLF